MYLLKDRDYQRFRCVNVNFISVFFSRKTKLSPSPNCDEWVISLLALNPLIWRGMTVFFFLCICSAVLHKNDLCLYSPMVKHKRPCKFPPVYTCAFKCRDTNLCSAAKPQKLAWWHILRYTKKKGLMVTKQASKNLCCIYVCKSSPGIGKCAMLAMKTIWK